MVDDLVRGEPALAEIRHLPANITDLLAQSREHRLSPKQVNLGVVAGDTSQRAV